MLKTDQLRFSLRPRIGGRRGQAREEGLPRFRQFILRRAQQRFSRLVAEPDPGRRTHFGGHGATADVPRPAPNARRCVIKAHVQKLRAGDLTAARKHLSYIERDGVEQDGSPGRLYSAAGDGTHDALSTALPNERHQFRFIISPEDADKIDLTAFTRDLMAQVERDTGRRLIWGAVNHHDTNNPHVHVVVRGVDVGGKEVRLERKYISERMRWQTQHLVTRDLGHRSEFELARQLERELPQERLTTVDRRLAKLLTRDRVLDTRRLAITTDGPTRARSMARVAVLEQFSLAQRTSAQTWQLVENWEEALRALGQRGDIIKRIHAALETQGDPARYVVVDGTAVHPPIEGVVRRKGLHDELRGDQYAVLETVRGQAYYVRVDPKTAEEIHEGSVVRLQVSREPWVKETDRVVQRVAAASHGVYDPAAHLRELRSRPLSIGGETVQPDAVIAANLRRLARLERYRLVARRVDGTWSVPPDLVSALEQRERTHPRTRLKVDVLASAPAREVRVVGPTWLDDQPATDSARAAYGFGAEITAALRERAAFLEQIGLRGTSKDIPGDLRRLEHLALGSSVAAELGYTFVAEPPAGFRGRLAACERRPSGSEFVRVVDEANRRVAVLPRNAAARALEGQVVELTREPQGGLVARRPGLSRGE